MTTVRADRPPTRTDWTDRLQIIAGVCSIVFTIGTALQNFAVVNLATLERMMVLAGQTGVQAADGAPGFLLGFRAVGCVYIAGNALGILALLRRNLTWLFWVVLTVNATQAAGVVMVPPEVFEASIDQFGPVGILPSVVTDGGALALTLLLLGFLIRFRRPWARPRHRSSDAASR